MGEPIVSVLLSVNRNRGGLKATMESVLSQSFARLELIVINDAAPPDVRDTLVELQARDARIRLLENGDNLGLTRSLNRGLGAARGRYIARVDEGDLWLPGKLEMQVSFLDARPVHVLVGTRYRNYSERTPEGRNGTALPIEDRQIRRWLFAGLTPIIHPSIVFRRGLVSYNPDASTSQDFDLFLRLSLIGKLHNLPEELLLSYTPADAVSVTHEDLQFWNHVHMHKQFLDALRGRSSRTAFVDNGTDFTQAQPRGRVRAGYVRFVLQVLRRLPRRGLARRVLRNALVPDYLIYYIRARSAPYRLRRTFFSYANDRFPKV
jgi:glycosyltransferase involved in cell wall biosynthesis